MPNPKRQKLAPILQQDKKSVPKKVISKPTQIKDAVPKKAISKPTQIKDGASRVLVKTEGKWYDGISGMESEADILVRELAAGDEKPLTKEELSSLLAKAEKLLNNDVGAYKAVSMRGDKRGDFLWMEKIMRTGTLSDKMAAFVIKIQDSPVHNLNCLQQLIGMVKSHGGQQCLTTADTARDLFLEDLLPPNRKLMPFDQRGTLLRTAGNKQLVMWLFEDKLKGHYRDFIEALRRMSSDTIDKIRVKGISVIYRLLETHPEQEHILLPLIVNKLGDPVKKVASGALFHLNKLLEKHPQMKGIVVDEVERLLFRNNIGKKAQYYGICFLNSFRVLGDESAVANKLVKLYLAFFKGCIKTGEIDSKMMSGLLNGVNKAFPVARVVGYEFTESLDTLYNIIQLSHFNIGVQALSLLFQITDGDQNANQDRFYRVLYRHLLSPEVATTSHSMQFLNVVFKAMKRDTVRNRVIGFSKRLLQLCSHLPPNLACAILFLISEVSKSHNGIILTGASTAAVDEEAGNFDEDSDGENRKQRKAEYLANVEKLAQNTNIKFDLESVKHTAKSRSKSNSVDDSIQEITEPKEESEEVVEVKEEKHKILTDYDPVARNPAYCGAELALAYELTSLTQHFHPSVALFSETLLNRRHIRYDGNPLKDFTVGRFLERFVYRNAKQRKNHPEYQPQGLRNVPVNSSEYLQTDEHKIPIEEKFFYKFFKDRIAEKKKKRTNKKDEDEDEPSDIESVDDEEFDKFMDGYFKSNNTGSDGEDDGDLDFAAEVKTQKTKKGKRKAQEEDEAESEDDNDDDDEEEAIDFDGDDDADELIDLDEGNDEMAEFDMEGGSDDDDFEEFGGKAFKEKLQLKTKKRKGKKDDAMFVDADAFSEMLEANADVAFTGSNTLINKDNSHVKQLKWETQRDRWVKGYKNKSKDKFSKKRKFQK